MPRVLINSDPEETIAEHLLHVGPATAKAIVAFRLKYGPLQSPAELALVDGISVAHATLLDQQIDWAPPPEPPSPVRRSTSLVLVASSCGALCVSAFVGTAVSLLWIASNDSLRWSTLAPKWLVVSLASSEVAFWAITSIASVGLLTSALATKSDRLRTAQRVCYRAALFGAFPLVLVLLALLVWYGSYAPNGARALLRDILRYPTVSLSVPYVGACAAVYLAMRVPSRRDSFGYALTFDGCLITMLAACATFLAHADSLSPWTAIVLASIATLTLVFGIEGISGRSVFPHVAATARDSPSVLEEDRLAEQIARVVPQDVDRVKIGRGLVRANPKLIHARRVFWAAASIGVLLEIAANLITIVKSLLN